MYVSQLFKKASACAELTCDRWYILSAKHGLIYPDQVIEPYDVRLTGSLVSPAIRQWVDMVRGQLDQELAGSQDIALIALAGRQYRTALEGSPWPYQVPMQGLGIGKQLGWLTAKLAADRG
ncbi:DUF6884 domain-containing protein [Arthrobacter sp. ISL-65]|uniref:DUF6884 domain-containing protein n=1 Tax=Arthrobacter sp. ISL-65 TaxID=2819112 RepID=UPI001BE7994F|nr:DUF6884 domain-containing protein [Arthrobacter sp. ISL-65]MBT2548955.1 hypothetical protein [Arthrobacter sp. ISL-65]